MKKHLRTLLSAGWALLALGYLGLLPKYTELVDIGFTAASALIALSVAVGLHSKHRWRTWSITVVSVISALIGPGLLYAYIGDNNSLVLRISAVLLLFFCVSTIVFVWKTRDELRPNGELSMDAKRVSKIFIAFAFGALVLGFAITEIPNIQRSFKKMRYESKCKDITVDIEACGQLGIAQLKSTDVQEMLAGRDLLDRLCKSGNAVACRRNLLGRTSWQIDLLTDRDLPAELWARCQQDGGTACLAIATSDYLEPEGFAELAKSKCSESDLDACIAWTIATQTDGAHTKSCELGISGSCATGRVPVEVRKKACVESKNPWTCFSANGGAEFCDRGVWPACDPVASGENHWDRIDWETRTQTKPLELTPIWESLEAGRKQIREDNAVWRPTPMPLAQIDATFGAACDAGIAYGCTEGANAAANVQLKFRSQERIEHAQKSLEKGCKNGDYLACWFSLSLPNSSPENMMKYARDACYSAPRGVRLYPELCRTYVHLWMADVGFTPWIMDTTLAMPDMIEKCAEQKDGLLCLAIAHSTIFKLTTPEPTAMPQYVAERDAAAIACSQNIEEGCELLINIALLWPVKPDETPQELADEICVKMPNMCERVEEALPLYGLED